MATEEPTLHRVVLTLCSACLDGEGDQCHTPGCALIYSRCPDLPLRDSCNVETIDGAPFDFDALKRGVAPKDPPTLATLNRMAVGEGASVEYVGYLGCLRVKLPDGGRVTFNLRSHDEDARECARWLAARGR